MRYHLTPMRTAVMKKGAIARAGKDVGGKEVGAAMMESMVEFPQKIKNRTTTGPGQPTSGHTPGGNGHCLGRRLHAHVCGMRCKATFDGPWVSIPLTILNASSF